MLFCYNILMNKDLKQIQAETAERLEKESENLYKQKQLKALNDIKETQLATIKGLADLIKGDTTKEEIIKQIKSLKFPDGSDKIVTAVDRMCLILDDKQNDLSSLEQFFEKAIEQLEKIPKELPEKAEAVQLDLSSTNTLLEGLQTAIGALKLEVTVSPTPVKIPQNKITVEKTDLSEIKQPLLDIISAISSIPVPTIEYTDTSLIEEKLDKSNKLLEKIEKKNFGGGGGGGSMLPFKDSVTDYSIQIPVTNGKIPVDIDMAAEGIATSAKQDEQTVTMKDMHNLMAFIGDRLEFGMMTDNAKRLKVNLSETTLATITTVSTVTTTNTVGTVNNQARMGDVQAQRMVEAMLDTSFTTGITNNLSIS